MISSWWSPGVLEKIKCCIYTPVLTPVASCRIPWGTSLPSLVHRHGIAHHMPSIISEQTPPFSHLQCSSPSLRDILRLALKTPDNDQTGLKALRCFVSFLGSLGLYSVYLKSIVSTRGGSSQIDDLTFSFLLLDHESRAPTSYLQTIHKLTDHRLRQTGRQATINNNKRQQQIIGKVYVTMYVLVNIWFGFFFLGW